MPSIISRIKTSFIEAKTQALAKVEEIADQTLAGELMFSSYYYYALKKPEDLHFFSLSSWKNKAVYIISQNDNYSIVKINEREKEALNFCSAFAPAILPPQNGQEYSKEYLQILENFLNSALYNLTQYHNRILKPTARAEIEDLEIEPSITKEELEKGYDYVRKYVQNLVRFLDIEASSTIDIIISEITADSKVKLTFSQTFANFKKEELKRNELDLKLKLNFLFGDNIELAAELLTPSWKEKTSASTIFYHFTINDFNKFSAYLKNFQEFGEQLHTEEGIILASEYFLKSLNIPLKLEVIKEKCYCTLTWPAGINIKERIHIYDSSQLEEQKLFTLYGNKLIFSSLEKLSLFTKAVEILEENNNYQRKINQIESYLGVKNASIKIVSSLQYQYVLIADGLKEALESLVKRPCFSNGPSFVGRVTEENISAPKIQNLERAIEDLERDIEELGASSREDSKYFSTFEELNSFLQNITETQAANINKEEIIQLLYNLQSPNEDQNENFSSGLPRRNSNSINKESDSGNESANESDNEPEDNLKALPDIIKLTRPTEDIEINYIKPDLEAVIEWQVKLPRSIKAGQALKANLQIINQRWLKNEEIILEEGKNRQPQFLLFKGFPLNSQLFTQELSLLRKYSLTFTEDFKKSEEILLEFLQAHNGAALGPVINIEKKGKDIYINFSAELRANIWFQILATSMQTQFWPSSGAMEIELFMKASGSLNIFWQEEFQPITMRKKELLEAAGLNSRLSIEQEHPYLIIDGNIKGDFQSRYAQALSKHRCYESKIKIFPAESKSAKAINGPAVEIGFSFPFLKKEENIITFYQGFLNILRNVEACSLNLIDITAQKIPNPDISLSFSTDRNWILFNIVEKRLGAAQRPAEDSPILFFSIESGKDMEEKEQIYIRNERTLAIKLDPLKKEDSAIPRALEKLIDCKLHAGPEAALAAQEELLAAKKTSINGSFKQAFLSHHYLIDFIVGLITSSIGAATVAMLALKFPARLQQPISFKLFLFSKVLSFQRIPILIASTGVGTFLIGAIITELCYECLKDKLENDPENKAFINSGIEI